MGNFIDPRCSTPLFRITDSSLAKSCGKLSGYYTSIFFSIFLSIIYGMYLYYLKNRYNYYNDNEKNDEYNQSKQTATTVFICVLVLLWIGLPILSGYYNVKLWEGFQYQINEFMKDGLTRQAALDKLEVVESAKNLASSIRMSGHRHHSIHH
jgi:hypothetical protein